MKFCEESLRSDWSFHDVRNQLRDSVFRRVEEALAAGDRERDAIRSAESLVARQEMVRERFLECLGGLPERSASLESRVTDVLKEEGLRIEKILFQARPGAWITANFYLPAERAGKIPAVLFLCGHAEEGKACPEYQNVCRRLARAGMAVLAQDPVGQGERFEYYDAASGALRVPGVTTEHDYEGKPVWALGRSLAGYFLADAVGGVDYLCSRKEVDAERIGLTGNSGGGTQASMLLLGDRRIAAAAIGTFLTSGTAILHSGKAQDPEQIWPGLTRLGIDHEDILLAAAPRPVLVLGVESDFFPMEGTIRTVERSRRYWELLGCPGWPRLATDCCEHQYSDLLAKRAADFFTAVFGLPAPANGPRERPLPKAALDCVSGGQLLAAIPDAATVRQDSKACAAELAARREALGPARSRDEGTAWLREQVMRDRKPGPFCLRSFERTVEEGLRCRKCLWSAEEGRLSSGAVFRDLRFDGERLPVTVAVWDGGTRSAAEHERWIRETCARGRMVLVVDPAGVGAVQPWPLGGAAIQGRFSTLYTLATELIRLGDSLCALRCYDVLRAVELAAQLEDARPGETELAGWGNGGVYALAAALLAGLPVQTEALPARFSQAARAEEYDSHTFAEIVLPGILGHMDLDDWEQWTR